MNLRIFDSGEDLLRSAARTIVQRVNGVASFSVALSGGSTPKPLYQMLGRSPMRDELRETAVTWVVVDERYVPVTDPQSNEGMIRTTIFSDGMAPLHRFLPFRTDFADPAESARQFATEWIALGIESLDIVILGVGDDGHTASLFPATTALDEEEKVATEVFVPRLDMWRVTITKPVIRAAKLRIVLATGEAKRPVLEAVRDGADHPIATVTAGLETWWFVDRAAAPK